MDDTKPSHDLHHYKVVLRISGRRQDNNFDWTSFDREIIQDEGTDVKQRQTNIWCSVALRKYTRELQEASINQQRENVTYPKVNEMITRRA